MIENMYPIQKAETDIAKHSRKLPRNIRACGQGGGPLPVYLEDYVATYIRRMAESGYPNCSTMILVGQVMETEAGRCLFVRGGINANKICEGDRPVFGEEVWSEVYEKIRLFFPDNEVVGWCIAGPGFRMLQEDVFLRAHIDNFGDCEKVFIAYESLEKELTVRICRYGSFCTLPGYYVYYEKNDEMQNYMLDAASFRHPQADKTPDTVKTIALSEEQPEKKRKQSVSGTSTRKDLFQLGAIACIIILIISVMVGTDALSVLKESAYGDGSEHPGPTVSAEKEEQPDAFAFGDFDFLDDESEVHQTIAETDKKQEEIQTAEPGEEKEPEQEQTLVPEESEQTENEEGKKEEEQNTTVQEADSATETDNPDRIEEETVTVLAPAEYNAYIVKSGDTLAQICQEMYGTVELLDYICELNQLESVDRIYVGQELIFPKK